jgi:hypothetical protein
MNRDLRWRKMFGHMKDRDDIVDPLRTSHVDDQLIGVCVVHVGPGARAAHGHRHSVVRPFSQYARTALKMAKQTGGSELARSGGCRSETSQSYAMAL